MLIVFFCETFSLTSEKSLIILGAGGVQAGSDVRFSSECMLCYIVVRKEQRTRITVETSPPKNMVGLGDPGPHHCTCLV